MKILFLFFTMVFFTACSDPQNLEKIDWKTGDDIRDLQFLNEIDRPLPTTFSVLNEDVEYSHQVYAGIPIENTFIKKINSKDGQLVSVSSLYKKDLKKFSKLDVKDYKATEPLKEKILRRFYFLEQKDLKTLTPLIDNSGVLAWSLFYFNKIGIPYQLKFDKHLNILSRERVGTNLFDGSALVYPLGPKLSSLKEVPIKNLSFSPALSNPQYVITSLVSAIFEHDVKVLRYAPQDSRFDQVQVYFYVAQALNWIDQTLGFKMITPLDIQLHIGFPEKTNAAFYYQGHIRLGAGDGVIYANIPQDPSIVSHEVFHALIDTVAHLPFEGEGGSLNEAFADYFTSQLLGSPHLGESSFLPGPYKRSVQNSKKWSDRTGALYGDSLIISGLLWELSQNISPTKIRHIALKTLTHLNPASQFNDFNAEFHAALQEYLTAEELRKALFILEERGFPK